MAATLSNGAGRAARTVLVCVAVFAASVASLACPKGCTQYGTCNEEIGRCDCPRHRTGDACQEELDLQALTKRCSQLGFPGVQSCVSNSSRCYNGCSHRGHCVAGFCHCKPGFYGTDCSLSSGPDVKPQLLAGLGYRPRSRGPRIYMYELPPRLTVWRNELRLDRPTTRFFIERLTASGVRVSDGDSADWYFIPVTLRRSSDGAALAEAVSYIRDTLPWWNRTLGHRHFVIATGDMGRIESERGSLSANVTFVTHWGLYDNRPFSGWRASHRNATDIVLPVFLGASKLSRMGIFASRNHPKFATKARPELRRRDGPSFFFAGRICGDHSRPRLNGSWPHCETTRSQGYSGGTRQLVHYHHWNRTGFFIQAGDPQYGKHLLTSKYCFGPMGGGHGQRQMQAALAGCVPVIISDGVLEAFEPYLDWNSFGVRLAEKDIPRLHQVLADISPQEYDRKVERLRCSAQHMAFSTITGAYLGESGRYDAFETLFEILRARAAHPGTPPEQLRSVDPTLDAFLDCRDPEGGKGEGEEGSKGEEAEGEEAEGEEAKGEGEGKASNTEREKRQQQQRRQQQQSDEIRAKEKQRGKVELEEAEVEKEAEKEAKKGAEAEADAGAGNAWLQQQRQQLLTAATLEAAAAGSTDRSSGRSSSSSSSGSSSRLCSVSPFDEGDPATPTCRSLSGRYRGPLYGGLMCVRRPTELVACPRPWD